jgi:hypothetical protein
MTPDSYFSSKKSGHQVCLGFEAPAQAGIHIVQELHDALVCQTIEDSHSPPVGDDNPLASEKAEMLGDVGLFPAHGRKDLTDASLTVGEGFEDLQPGRLSESFQEIGFELPEIIVRHDGSLLLYVHILLSSSHSVKAHVVFSFSLARAGHK